MEKASLWMVFFWTSFKIISGCQDHVLKQIIIKISSKSANKGYSKKGKVQTVFMMRKIIYAVKHIAKFSRVKLYEGIMEGIMTVAGYNSNRYTANTTHQKRLHTTVTFSPPQKQRKRNNASPI